MKKPIELPLVSAKTIAETLNVSTSTVRRAARAGRIPSVPCGQRLLRFDFVAVLAAWRAARRPAATDTDGSMSDASTPIEP